VANNTFHLWLTTTINGSVIIPPDALQHLSPGLRVVFHLISLNDAAIYIRVLVHTYVDTLSTLLGSLLLLSSHAFTMTGSGVLEVMSIKRFA
jgi:hypothetical protein